ncbi:MAG: helix-turn-helix transcriptional regulator [Clostridia bacterium]|nr:helix-turn-helix transcriptional regulator [Clostridia bacterium]
MFYEFQHFGVSEHFCKEYGKACYMLNNTNCTVIQCALDCGFTSLRSFNRNFKLQTSLTPQQYRGLQ